MGARAGSFSRKPLTLSISGQLCFADAFGQMHVNSVASQHAGAHILHRFVAIDDEHVFRSHLKGNRRLL
ncbi:MAG: hypothetical protein DMG85_18440 [Acidobacteria bacterium]|nr:MAG: hypothetical protein DMG85_18440 [Acidobacteriota bacterium]